MTKTMENFESKLSKMFRASQKVKLGFWEKQTVGFKVMGDIFGSWAAAGLLVPQKAVAIAGLTLFLTGSGSVWAMEKALPGDLLYGGRAAMHSAIGVMVKASPEAAANWAIKEINRITREIDKLKFKGELSTEAEAEANEAIKVQLGNFYEAKEAVVVKKGPEAGEVLEKKLVKRYGQSSGKVEIKQEVKTGEKSEKEQKKGDDKNEVKTEIEGENKVEIKLPEVKVNEDSSLKLKLEL